MLDRSQFVHETVQDGIDVDRIAHRLDEPVSDKLPIMLSENRQLAGLAVHRCVPHVGFPDRTNQIYLHIAL
jgi:hypothetical protein